MKSRFLFVVILATLLLPIVPAHFVSAQVPLTTAFAVQNMGTQDATIVVQWYAEEGDLVYTSPSVVVAPGALGNFLAGTGLASSWSGSVVISADQPIAAISNTTNDFGSPSYWGSSEGFKAEALSTNAYLPFVLRDRGGRNSTIGVQNTGSAQANVYINFIGHSSSPVNFQVVKTLNAGASTILNLNSEVTSLGSGWMGSVIITSTQKVAASALDMGSNIVYAYSGVPAPATDLVMPFVVGGRSGQDTAHALLNPNTVAANVTITYTGESGGVPVQVVVNRQLQPSEMWNQLHSAQTGSGFLGSAILHSDQPVLGIVNHTYGSFAAAGRKMAYSMINAATLTPNISLPYVLRARSNKAQGVIIQNAGTVPTTLSVSFTPLAGTGNGTAYTYTKVVQPGQFYNFGTSFAEWNPIQDGAYGTMVVTNSANVNIVAIVNTWSTNVSSGVDSLGSYIGINY